MSLSPALALSLVVEPIGQVPVVTGFSVWREYLSRSGFAKSSGDSPENALFPQDSPVSPRPHLRSLLAGCDGIPVTHRLPGYVHRGSPGTCTGGRPGWPGAALGTPAPARHSSRPGLVCAGWPEVSAG